MTLSVDVVQLLDLAVVASSASGPGLQTTFLPLNINYFYHRRANSKGSTQPPIN